MGFLANVLAPGSAQGAAQGSLGLGTLATSANAAGSVLSGIGAKQEADYAATGSEEAARAALASGSYAESIEKAKTTRLVTEQKAAQAANGIEVGSGSATAVRRATQDVGDLDAAMIHYNTARVAFGLDEQAKMQRAAGRGALAKGLLGAGTSFLSGASSLADKWSTYRLSGANRGT